MIFLFFLHLGLSLLYHAGLHFLDVAVVVIEPILECSHLVRYQTKSIFKLPLHKLDMRLHHICQELCVHEGLLLPWLCLLLLRWYHIEVLGRECAGRQDRWDIIMLVREVYDDLIFV